MDTYLIAPFSIGQQNNVKPWLLPEDALEELENAYIQYGRIRKRFGYRLIGSNISNSQLRSNLGVVQSDGTFSGTLADIQVGQAISIGNKYFIISSIDPTVILSPSDPTITITIDASTKGIQINSAPVNSMVASYLALPVMGQRLRETGEGNFEDTIWHDPKYAYKRLANTFVRMADGDSIWTGDDSQFFWSINFRGETAYQTYYYCVNYNRPDNIRYVSNLNDTWVRLRPKTNEAGTEFLDSCRILIGFQDRMIALNTLETDGDGAHVYPSRARWTQRGDPRNPDVSWVRQPGRGGFYDADTRQQIIGAEIIKGHLMVSFERSTWELEYTGYVEFPFRWRQINSELGRESTFSGVTFDEGSIGIGNVGVTNCNGVGVRRIDEKIPDEVYKFHNCCTSVERIYGIRDFVKQLVYWTVPYRRNIFTYPNRIMVYNYLEGSYSFTNDSFTCFGYYQKRESMTWATVGQFYPTWAAWKVPWRSGKSQSAFPDTIAGNQHGIVFVIDNENNTNAVSEVVSSIDHSTRIITTPNHNRNIDDYLRFENGNFIAKVNKVIDKDNYQIDEDIPSESIGGELVRLVSNWYVKTKQFNPGTPIGQRFHFPHIDFLLDVTVNGEMEVDYITESNIGSTIQTQTPPWLLDGDMRLYSKPDDFYDGQGQIIDNYAWRRYFPEAQGNFIQLIITMSDAQMRNWSIAQESFVLHGILLYVRPCGRIAP